MRLNGICKIQMSVTYGNNKEIIENKTGSMSMGLKDLFSSKKSNKNKFEPTQSVIAAFTYDLFYEGSMIENKIYHIDASLGKVLDNNRHLELVGKMDVITDSNNERNFSVVFGYRCQYSQAEEVNKLAIDSFRSNYIQIKDSTLSCKKD